MASVNSSEDVAAKVQEWAIAMNFVHATGSASPNTEDFQSMCKGRMKNILSFIVGHVQPIRTVNKVRSLVLNRRQAVVNGVSGSRPMDIGSAALDSAVAADEAEERSIKKLGDKCLAAETKLQELMDSVQSRLERAELLEALARNANPKTKYMEDQTKTLISIYEECIQKSRKTAKMPEFVQRDVGEAFPVLETVYMKDVREACQMQSKIVASVVHGIPDPNEMNRTKEDLRHAVRKILLANGSTDVLRCLTEMSSAKSDTEKAEPQEASSLEPSFDMNKEALMIGAKIESIKAEIHKMRTERKEFIEKIDAKLMEFHTEDDATGIAFKLAKKDIEERLSETQLKAVSVIQQTQANRLRLDVQHWTKRTTKFEIDFRMIGIDRARMVSRKSFKEL